MRQSNFQYQKIIFYKYLLASKKRKEDRMGQIMECKLPEEPVTLAKRTRFPAVLSRPGFSEISTHVQAQMKFSN